jgi:hypothetical protein
VANAEIEQRHRKKGELAAGLEQVRRIDEADGQPGKRERVGRHRRPPQDQAAGRGADHHGGTQDGRTTASQESVGHEKDGDAHRRVASPHRHDAHDQIEERCQDHEVVSGDGQGVNYAGALVLVPVLLRHGRPFPEQQRDRDAATLAWNRLHQGALAPIAQHGYPPSRRPVPAFANSRHRIGRLADLDLSADVLVAQGGRGVYFARISRAARRLQAADDLNRIADMQTGKRPVGYKSRAARHGQPVVLKAQVRDAHYSQCRIRDRDRPQVAMAGRLGRSRDDGGFLGQHSAHPHRPRFRVRVIANIVGGIDVAANVVICRAERRHCGPKTKE